MRGFSSPLLVAGLALIALVLGAQPFPSQAMVVVAVVLLITARFCLIRLGITQSRATALALMLPLLLAWACWWGQPRPGPLDPVRLLASAGSFDRSSRLPLRSSLEGRLLSDSRLLRDSRFVADSCRALLAAASTSGRRHWY